MTIEGHFNQSPELLQCKSWGWDDPQPKIVAEAVNYLLARSMRSGDYLVQSKVISREELEAILATKPATVHTLEWVVQNYNSATPYYERFITYAAGMAYYDSLNGFAPHPCMSDKVVLDECELHDFVVLQTDRGVPVMVCGSVQAFYLRSSLGRPERAKSPTLIALRACDQFDQLRQAVSRRDQVASYLNDARNAREQQTAANPAETGIWIGNSPDSQSRSETREMARIFDTAIHDKATDIDIRTQPDGSLTFFIRQFGDLRATNTTITAEVGPRALHFLMRKSGANPSGAKMREPNDGHLSYRASTVDAQLRLSFIPLNHPGETVQQMSTSIRIMRQQEDSIDLQSLHLHASVIDELIYALRLSQGLIVLAGPTNTGKSTTIAAAVGQHVAMFGVKKKRISVEDPIERWVKGLLQIQVPHQDVEENRFSVLMRAIKRHDPDLIWLGEVRDKETAESCVQYASSGHLVLTTLHATDTLVALDVLAKMVPPDMRYQLIESLLLVVSQRLVKRLCDVCKIIHPVPDEDLQILRKYAQSIGAAITDIPTEAAYPVGCEECVAGYTSIVPINETLPMTRAVKDAWLTMIDRNDTSARNFIDNARTVTLLQASLLRVRNLETDVSQVLL